MSRYTPKVAIKVVKPCSEIWEAMPGDVRVRHCGSCDHDVHNLAAMTPAQIDALLAATGPLPCMRVAWNDDGSMMTAAVVPGPSFLSRASLALSAVVLMAGSAAAQTSASPPGKPATLKGYVVDPTGANIPDATVTLHGVNNTVITAHTDIHGEFNIDAEAGKYTFDASRESFIASPAQVVVLHAGVQQLDKPIALQVGMVTMGDMVVDARPAKTRKVKKTKQPSSSAAARP
jgi:ribosomal protein S11